MKRLEDILGVLKNKKDYVKRVANSLNFKDVALYVENDGRLHFFAGEQLPKRDALLQREQNFNLLLSETFGCEVVIHTDTEIEALYLPEYRERSISIDQTEKEIKAFYQRLLSVFSGQGAEERVHAVEFYSAEELMQEEEDLVDQDKSSFSLPEFLFNLKKELGLGGVKAEGREKKMDRWSQSPVPEFSPVRSAVLTSPKLDVREESELEAPVSVHRESPHHDVGGASPPLTPTRWVKTH